MQPNETKSYQFQAAFVDGQWLNRPVFTIADGLIQSIKPALQPESPPTDVSVEQVDGVALPGMINVHSHAFQRALAGRSEFRTTNEDSFWTWRQQMYEFLASFQPDDIYRIARQLYSELISGGYTTVGEFHYLHTDQSGANYARLNELSAAVAQAAVDSGINFCFIPTLYQQGGFGKPLESGQKRFYLTEDQFFRLIEDTCTQFGNSANFQLAMALHSLRAVSPDVGKSVIKQFLTMYPQRPIHMHVAEQQKEVDDCVAATGRRSIEYLFEQYEVDSKWCLIHCTQALNHELQLIADAGAVVGLCPTTEANLGDGIFPAVEFLAMGGRIGIGTDSQVSCYPSAELRMLEYSQRLQLRRRALLAIGEESVGRRLYRATSDGGATALGIAAGSLAVGLRADLIVLDPQHPSIDDELGDRLIDRWLFCDYGNPVTGTMVGGKWISPR